jgi:hypothetical protein
MTNPKCLLLDIETFQMLVSVWELKDQYVGHNQVRRDWNIAAWSAKWLGEKPIFYRDQSYSKDDTRILWVLRDLLNRADFVMTQNGIKFDWPKIQARLMLNHIPPPSHFEHIDLYKEFKKVGFTSHSLDYMTDKFCTKYKKLHHLDFPGDSLWQECEKGNPKAWASMKKYNIHDVLSLEELFEKTKEWLPKIVYKLSQPVAVCKTCGGKTFKSEGQRHGNAGIYSRRYCKQCGNLFKGVV